MNVKTQQQKPLLFTALALLLISFSVFLACRKTGTNESPSPLNSKAAFNAAAAKEWFYGVFKKTPEFTGVPVQQEGKKLPHWQGGQYKKLGNTEVVEYPLVQQKKRVPVKTTAGSIDARLAEAAITRALFIQKNGTTVLRLVQWVPTAEYAQKKGYDISQASLLNPENDFTGKVLITRWNGTFIKGYQMENGRKTRSITKMQNMPKSVEETATPNTPINPDCYYSYYAWAEQNCTVYTSGDDISVEVCSNWELVWDNLQETSCPVTQGECELLGLSTEDCLCQTMGVGCDEEGNIDELCAQNAEICDNEAAMSVSPESINLTGALGTKDTTIKWTIAKHTLNTWQVVAFTRYLYNRYAISNQNYTHIQDVQTVNTDYEGSNAVIQTTWTEKSKKDDILVNNSPNAKTKSTVIGKLNHVCKRAPHPACIWLRSEENVMNSLEATF